MSDRAPLIVVLVDGLSARVARRCAGALGAFAEAGAASYGEIRCELPSLSRPLYECLLTGRRPLDSGRMTNEDRRPSPFPSLFSLAREGGIDTAAAAYHWISELYVKSPFDSSEDRIRLDSDSPIRRGIFYFEDDYPDSHVLADGEFLRRRFSPGLLLIHTMNVDLAGHRHGPDSLAYRDAIRRIDGLLSLHVPLWLDSGANILITSDHGMGPDGRHGGGTAEERRVPLWLLGPGFARSLPGDLPLLQTTLCGTCCRLLGVDPGDRPVCPDLLSDPRAAGETKAGRRNGDAEGTVPG